jgi:hypothetical protein
LLQSTAPIGLAGTLTTDNTSLTFTALDAQVVTFTGTDSKNVGCAASDRGRVTGINFPYFANQLNGTFISSAEGIFSLAGDIAQRAAQAMRPALKSRGTVAFDTPCDPAQSSPQ